MPTKRDVLHLLTRDELISIADSFEVHVEDRRVKRPDISILLDDFLAEVRNLPQKHVAAELLRKLLENEIKGHTKTNLVKSVAFSEMVDSPSSAIGTARSPPWKSSKS